MDESCNTSAHAGESARYLNVFCIRLYFVDETNFCPVYVAVRKMLEEVSEREDVQFFLEHVRAERAYAFEIFDGVG